MRTIVCNAATSMGHTKRSIEHVTTTNDMFNSRTEPVNTRNWSENRLVVRIRNATIEQIRGLETRRVKELTMVSGGQGVSLALELPDALCEGFKQKETTTVLVDAEPISKGDDARFYAEASVFKITTDAGQLHVVSTIGGLRVAITFVKPTPSQKRVFSSGKFYIAII